MAAGEWEMGGGRGMGVLTDDGAWLALDGAILQNNTWGRGELVSGADYRQSVAYGDALSDGVRFDWDWEEQTPRRVLAYPSLWIGRKPFLDATAGESLPARLDAIDGLTLDYSLNWGGDLAGFNVSLDLWLSRDPDGGRDVVAEEIMVWIKSGTATPGGSVSAELRLDGADYEIRTREHDSGWGYAALVAETPAKAGRIDLGAILDHLRQTGAIAPDLWLMDVELGAEVTGGAGWLEVQRFDLDLDEAPHGGGPGEDTMRGNAASDLLRGGLGHDSLRGGDGADRLEGGRGADRLFGGIGEDRLAGGGGEDRLSGGGGVDHLKGGYGDDRLFGDAGSDRLAGGPGDDLLKGGPGADSLHGGRGADLLRGGAGDDRLAGGGGTDKLLGGPGHDSLAGSAGTDILSGGPGRDRLSGGPGADELDGGAGRDVLCGGGGADVFRFAPESGRDVIEDFEPGANRLDLRAFDLDAPPEATEHAGGAHIEIEGAMILLRGIDPHELDADCFLL